jgi:hypothetical protein
VQSSLTQRESKEFGGRHREASATTRTRYRLDVIASSVNDVVLSAGGWLFHRAMAGWDVNLLIAEPCDPRPLHILGIRTLPVELAIESVTKWPTTQAIAVGSDVLNTNVQLREDVVAALERGVTEVTLWGDTWLPEFRHRADAVQHRLSAAARAFKGQAVAAAALPPDSVAMSEMFRTGSRWCSPYEPDLIPMTKPHAAKLCSRE